MKLRPYQQAAVDAAYKFFRSNEPTVNPVIVLPTGTGKTHVIRQVCYDVVNKRQGRAVVLAHRKELLAQAEDKMDFGDVSVYSASLGRKCLEGNVILGQIQSLYKRGQAVGKTDIVIVDECHLVTPEEDGMFSQFLGDVRASNPGVRFLGLTATPYRMKEGEIFGENMPWDAVCYEYEIDQAVADGYLTRLVSTRPSCSVSHEGLHVRAGEYIASEVEARVDGIVDEACRDILAQTADRNHVLVFCVSRRHAREVAAKLGGRYVLGDMTRDDRDQTIADFKSGKFKYLVNVDVLTTGFDATMVDAIAMLRPTLSRGLFVQIAGRGMRLHPGKEDCLFLDYGSNIQRHGPIDAPYNKPRKVWTKDSKDPETKLAQDWECPECGRLNDNGFSQCEACSYVRVKPPVHDVKAAHLAIMQAAGVKPKDIQWLDVEDVMYVRHVPRDEHKNDTLRVDYQCETGVRVSEWVCIEHDGWARKKAEEWWRHRSNDPCPADIDLALQLIKFGSLAKPLKLKVDLTEKWPKVLQCRVDIKPARVVPEGGEDEWWEVHEAVASRDWDDDDIPF